MRTRLTFFTLLILLFLGWSKLVKAQTSIEEKVFDISSEAQNGYLAKVLPNEEKQTIDVIYIIPSATAGKVKYEVYTYDKDMTLLNTVKEEDDIANVKSKWSWFNYKGDSYSASSYITGRDMKSKLQFRKKETTYTFNWKNGTYTASNVIGESIYPKVDYFYKGGTYENKADKIVFGIGGRPSETDPLSFIKNYDIVSCDNQANTAVVGSLDFEYINMPIFSAPLTDERVGVSELDVPRDWILVFAPEGNNKKAKDPKSTNFTYVRISPKGQIIERFTFESPSSSWRISGAHEVNGSVILYGSAISKDAELYCDKAFKNNGLVASTSASEAELKSALDAAIKKDGAMAAMKNMGISSSQESRDNILDEMAYTLFQIAKITKGKVEFITCTGVEDFAKKQAKPASQKKFVEFDGKKFIVSGITVSPAGDIFVSGQDFAKKATNSWDGLIYKGLYLFQFDAKGVLTRNYGVQVPDQKDYAIGGWNKLGLGGGKKLNDPNLSPNMVIATSYLYPSLDGKTIHWLLLHAKDVYCCGEKSSVMNNQNCIPIFGCDYGSINATNGEASGFKPLTTKQDFYSLGIASGYKMGNYMYFLSSSGANAAIPVVASGREAGYTPAGQTFYCFIKSVKESQTDQLLITRIDISK